MHFSHLCVHYVQHFIDDLAVSSRSGSPRDSSVQLEGLNEPPHDNSADVDAIFLHESMFFASCIRYMPSHLFFNYSLIKTCNHLIEGSDSIVNTFYYCTVNVAVGVAELR